MGEIIVPKKNIVVCFLHSETHIWLGERKTGPWVGKWNGPGGKIEPGEYPEQAQQREAFEEIGVEIALKDLQLCGVFRTRRSDIAGSDRILFLFAASRWYGEPHETREMKPHLAPRSELDFYYKKMLPGDEKLIPPILAGERRMSGIIVRKDDEGTLDKLEIY